MYAFSNFKKIQTFLKGNLYPRIIVTGNLDAQTKTYIKLLQKNNKLKQTGLIDSATIQVLKGMANCKDFNSIFSKAINATPTKKVINSTDRQVNILNLTQSLINGFVIPFAGDRINRDGTSLGIIITNSTTTQAQLNYQKQMLNSSTSTPYCAFRNTNYIDGNIFTSNSCRLVDQTNNIEYFFSGFGKSYCTSPGNLITYRCTNGYWYKISQEGTSQSLFGISLDSFNNRIGGVSENTETNNCTFENTPLGSFCGGKCHSLSGMIGTDFWSPQCTLGF
jgi:peptidoglycan hydrolase-like protein with peptidoglycan-binding domain